MSESLARSRTTKEEVNESVKTLIADELTEVQQEQFLKKRKELRSDYSREKSNMDHRHREEAKALENQYKGYERDMLIALINGEKITKEE